MNILMVGVGGAGGALSRYIIGLVVARYYRPSFPLATFVINVSGAFLLGLSMAYFTQSILGSSFLGTYLLQIGFLGGYTTFSTFGYETLNLIEDGEWLNSALYFLGSTVLGLLAYAIAFHIY